jgi:hypothetical protein
MSEVKANKVADFESCLNPGDFFITPPNPHEGGDRRLSFICPCGKCGALCGIRIRDDGQRVNGAWGWNRDEEKPTLAPSININNEHWHGYLINGIFRLCQSNV